MTAPTAPELRRLAELEAIPECFRKTTEEIERSELLSRLGGWDWIALAAASLMDERDRLVARESTWREWAAIAVVPFALREEEENASMGALRLILFPLPAPSTNEPAAKEGA